ncbi:calcium/sodium antiporter [Amorphoplanes nipponensis]|uniref:Calcium/sodium antiporter n=2 Tax=Actinoplanes nipponensis TaxID=135950 RepID=A0A919JBT8_9ACTN|nr:sodium:calcium antiporter [Actinoplanes nipponensis]GIE48089.1 calcium/sodium antiporter [Actinoplanes nipponensis]
MWEFAVLGLAGLIVMTVAADQLVVGSGRLAARWGVSPVVVGVVVIGFGTSAPELVVSGLAAAHGETGLALGNLAGSDIINLTLVLGLAGLVGPLAVRSSVPRREAPLAAAAVALFALLAAVGLGRAGGAVLALATGGAVVLLLRFSRVRPADPMAAEVTEFLATGPAPRAGRDVLRALLGLAGTLLGAQVLVSSAAGAAGRLGLSPAVIGFTVVALGTSVPELVTTVQAQRRREGDLVVGNLLGSNLINSVGGGALVGLAGRGTPARLGWPAAGALVGVSLLAWLLLHRRRRLTRPEAGLLLVVYLLTVPLLV